jgi:outer membrane protein assembly factor BamD
MRFLLIIFCAFFFASCGTGVNKILKSKDPAYKLSMAEKFYAKKKFGKAQQIYEDVTPYYKTSPQYEDIYYKLVYAVYNQHDYMNAENHFKNFLEGFPNSARSEEMEYMRAFCYYKQAPKAELDPSNTYKAIGMMQTFVNTHPGSVRINEAARIIEELRKRLEKKEYLSAKLYFDMGQSRAAGVAFSSLLDNFPESMMADQYKLMVIKSYFKYAELSIAEKKVDRFKDVITHCNDFIDRFPESKFRKDVESFITSSNSEIKKINTNEQVKTPA